MNKMISMFIMASFVIANNLNPVPNLLTHKNHGVKPQQENPWFNINKPNLIPKLLRNENLYGVWELNEIMLHADSTFSGGEPCGECLVGEIYFSFYDDNTLIINFSESGESGFQEFNWITEGDSIFIYFDYYGYEELVVSGPFEFTNDNQNLTLFFIEEFYDYYGSYIIQYEEFKLSYYGSTDDISDCGDPDACNFSPGAIGDYDCMYADDYGWCNCEGSYYDCSGECGGGDTESCTIMYPDEFGIYGNNDCSGELITEISGQCWSFDYYGYFIFSEDDCLEIGGIWLAAETCYSFEFNFEMSAEECSEAGGLYNDYYYLCYLVLENDFATIDECMCGEGGIIGGYYEDNCIEGEEQDNEWIESEELFDDDNGLPVLYFYNDGTFSESCEYECEIEDIPSEEDCEDAGGDYGWWSECEFEVEPSQEECEYAYGYWDQYNEECYIYYEYDCIALGGTWIMEFECYVDDEESCFDLDGDWVGGICSAGNFEIEEDSITLIFFNDPDDGPGVEEIMGTLIYDDNGNWLGMDFALPDWYSGICLGFTFTSEPPLAITAESSLSPSAITIQNIYPNPFNPVSTISFEISEYTNVNISVFNLKGEQVAELMKGEFLNSGYYEIAWDAASFSSGIYFVTLRVGNIIQSQKITLVK